MSIKVIQFNSHGDERGQLIALEQRREIPFDVKRVYYMYETCPNVVRGKHAHKDLEQVLVCLHGECKVMLDDGKQIETVILNRPDLGLYISGNIWRELYDFQNDAVILVLASKYYDEKDYIRDYQEFLEYIN